MRTCTPYLLEYECSEHSAKTLPQLFHVLIQCTHRLVQTILDGVIRFVGVGLFFERGQSDLGGVAVLEKAAGANGFEAHAWVRVFSLRTQQGERIADAI